jgi:hypothetical protein
MNIKPTALHEASGTYVKDPQRKRKSEPHPRAGIGPAKPDASCDFSDVWDELVDSICPGVLGNSDRIWLEITTRLLCEYRQNPTELSSAKINQLQKGLSHLGMSPVDRTRITAQEQEKKSKEDAYF